MNIADQASFGGTLKSIRRELGLSQNELALTIGSTQRHVSFLESGRSQPSRDMIGRLSAELGLSPGWRAALFEASGFQNPYPRRDLSSNEILETLDMLEARVLAHWPFGAFILDKSWNLLRMNAAAKTMFEAFIPTTNEQLNMLTIRTSEQLIDHILNWEDCAIALYLRMQKHARQDENVRRGFEDAKARGVFDTIAQNLAQQTEVPIFMPVHLRIPDGSTIRLTSLVGSFVSVHDAVVDGFDIEFVVPMDQTSEERMLPVGSQQP